MFDLKDLLLPIDGALPAGPDLSYTGIAELERLASVKVVPLLPGSKHKPLHEDPDWAEVSQAARALLLLSKDLRAAVWLTRAELALRGWAGLADGLGLIAALLRDFWPGLHPPLVREESDDPIDRMNILANLSPAASPAYGSVHAENLRSSLLATVVVDSREVGRFTLRDLDPARVASSSTSAELLAAAWRRSDPVENEERRIAVAAALEALQQINAAFRERSARQPSLDELRDVLTRVARFYEAQQPADREAVDDAVSSAGAAPGEARPPGAAVTNRGEAMHRLRQVATYLREAEPSSPAPLYVERALALIGLDFNAILKELMPEAKDRARVLAGLNSPDAGGS